MCFSLYRPMSLSGHLANSNLSSLPSFSLTPTSTAIQDLGWLRELTLGSGSNRHYGEVSSAEARRSLTEMTQANYMTWKGSCVKCGKVRRAGHGLFCSNYLLGRASFPPCRNVWCGECYQEASDDRFPRLDDKVEAVNVSDLEVEVPLTLDRYRCGRNGDHLMGVPFECDLCSFRNMCGGRTERISSL